MPTPRIEATCRDIMARAGGDPDDSGALAIWATQWNTYSHVGVVVTRSGRIVAHTEHVGGRAGAHYVTECDEWPETMNYALSVPEFRRLTGEDVIHVTSGDVH